MAKRLASRWPIVPACLLLAASAHACRSSENFQGQLGEPCDSNLDCSLTLACQEQTDTCQSSLEEEPEGLGADCLDNNGCGADLLCQPETNTCQVIEDGEGIPGPVLLGGPCAEDAECDEGLLCQFASGTCQPTGGQDIDGLGATCVTNGDCLGDLICQPESTTCQIRPPEQ